MISGIESGGRARVIISSCAVLCCADVQIRRAGEVSRNQ
jgi:hypothetical protein